MNCCQCQGDADFKGYQLIDLQTIFGEIRVSRARYRCSDCGTTVYPIERFWRLSSQKFTPAAAEVCALAGTLTSFGKAQFMVEKLSEITACESTIQKITEDLGQLLAQHLDEGTVFELPEHWDWTRDAEGKKCGYAGLDGIHVRMQGENATSAETRVAWVGRIYNPCIEQERLDASAGESRYQAGFCSLEEMGRRLERQANQLPTDAVERWICITDGGNGLEELLNRTFCQSVWILDFYHAKEYLVDFANAWIGEEESRRAWLDDWCHCLKHEGGERVLARLEELDLTDANCTAQEAYERLMRYYRNHQHGMEYPYYRKMGWQIGSGPTEGACKSVVGDRLKQSGMRWGEEGGNGVMHLRALYYNGKETWNHFFRAATNPSFN